jgi:hypothetical protein
MDIFLLIEVDDKQKKIGWRNETYVGASVTSEKGIKRMLMNLVSLKPLQLINFKDNRIKIINFRASDKKRKRKRNKIKHTHIYSRWSC